MTNIDLLQIQIAAHEIGPTIPVDASLEERIKAAIQYIRRTDERDLFFLSHSPVSDDLKLRTALGTVMVTPPTTPAECDLIVRSLAPLRALDAAAKGVPVDWDAALAGVEDLLPLMKLWREAE